MLCASGGHDVLKEYTTNDWKTDGLPIKRWKTEGVSTRNIATSSWVNDIRSTKQEKLVEQALNLDLNNLSEQQLIDIFVAVTGEPECKARGYIYQVDNDLILAFQNYFDNRNKTVDLDKSCDSNNSAGSFSSTSSFPSKDFSTPTKRPSRPQRDSFSKDCDHRCCMMHADACCDCSDTRPMLDSYDIYIKDEGVCVTPYRWLFYCPVCKRRTQALDPPLSRSGSYAPLYRPKVRQRTCSKHKVCPTSCSRANKDSCIIC